jgi:hypothetical protein
VICDSLLASNSFNFSALFILYIFYKTTNYLNQERY